MKGRRDPPGRKDVWEYFGVMRGPTVQELPGYVEGLRNAIGWLEGKRICAVIMAAHQVRREWIQEALKSIRRQRPLEGWIYTLNLGVDGCEASSELLLELGEPHWFSAENVGPYVIRNSLMQLAPADSFAVFDADDVMHRDYLKTLIPLAVKHGVAGAARRTINGRGYQLLARSLYGSGVSVIARRVMDAAGSFKPWRNGADWDFCRRVDALGFTRHGCKDVLYDRRSHPSTLHRRVGKEGREAAVTRAQAELEQGILHVPPVTVPLERRWPNGDRRWPVPDVSRAGDALPREAGE